MPEFDGALDHKRSDIHREPFVHDREEQGQDDKDYRQLDQKQPPKSSKESMSPTHIQ